MYPGVLLWYPEVAASLLQYRYNRIPGAQAKAKSYNPPYDGTMFPVW
jgi:trehalose/maltose hydrolase-like predicted phosphorylase